MIKFKLSKLRHFTQKECDEANRKAREFSKKHNCIMGYEYTDYVEQKTITEFEAERITIPLVKKLLKQHKIDPSDFKIEIYCDESCVLITRKEVDCLAFEDSNEDVYRLFIQYDITEVND